MYEVVLSIHNVMRWVVLVLAILVVVRAFRGWLGRREWTPADRRTGSFFAMTLDIQLLLGLLLYFVLSPITTAALRDFGAAMRSVDMRFFALEHALYMFLAVVFGHLGNALPRRVEQAVAKHRRAAIWFGLAFLALLIGMPWMRPLLRF
jgi:hypothetical protein